MNVNYVFVALLLSLRLVHHLYKHSNFSISFKLIQHKRVYDFFLHEIHINEKIVHKHNTFCILLCMYVYYSFVNILRIRIIEGKY